MENWRCWQYGGDYRHPTNGWVVPGYKEGAAYGVQNDSIDLNAHNGTLEAMWAWLGITPPDEPEEPPEAQPLTLEQRVDRAEQLFREHGWL
jgi:hypothetical protein